MLSNASLCLLFPDAFTVLLSLNALTRIGRSLRLWRGRCGPREGRIVWALGRQLRVFPRVGDLSAYWSVLCKGEDCPPVCVCACVCCNESNRSYSKESCVLSPPRVCVYGVVGFIVVLQLMYVCMYVGEGSCVRVEYLIRVCCGRWVCSSDASLIILLTECAVPDHSHLIYVCTLSLPAPLHPLPPHTHAHHNILPL